MICKKGLILPNLMMLSQKLAIKFHHIFICKKKKKITNHVSAHQNALNNKNIQMKTFKRQKRANNVLLLQRSRN